jgi:hypothetical protein
LDKETEKLLKLCEHWANHNNSHKEDFLKWRDIAKLKGLEHIAEKLDKAIEAMDKCTEYLILAREQLNK